MTGRSRTRSLAAIIGMIGVVGLVMVMLLKYLCLYHVPLELKNAALLFMPTAGRWMQVCLACYSPYIRPEGGTGSAFVENVGQAEGCFHAQLDTEFLRQSLGQSRFGS